LNNLGVSLQVRFDHFGDLIDLDAAIARQREAVNLTPNSHSQKPGRLSNLGLCLKTRFNRLGNPIDIDDSIARHKEAIKLTPDSHPDKPARLANLGLSFQARYDQLKNLTDLETALETKREAVSLTPDGHPEKPSLLLNLSKAYMTHFLHSEDLADTQAAISCCSAAAMSTAGPATMRFSAVERWISLSSLLDQENLLSAYECALDLMPVVAWLGLPIADRHQHLVKIGGIARDAAAAAISAEKYDKALEWLEQGRSIVWTQILQLRTPVDELREVNADLASRIVEVARLLDHGAERSNLKDKVQSIEEEGRLYRALATEWDALIEQVRRVPNFEHFLRPPKVSQLIRAAQNGPVVVLNISEIRCDALAIIPGMDDVVHIPLPNITSVRVSELRQELDALLSLSGVRAGSERAAKRMAEESDDEACKAILSELWTVLVKPVIDSLAFSVGVFGYSQFSSCS
jgi:tetratricopeptide (TPR) repeat protein